MVAGIALINMLWASMALFGLTLLTSMLPWLFWAIKVAGGTYLVWFGVQLLRRSNEPLQARGATTASGLALKVALRDGIATNLSNPKSMAFYASVFSGAVPKDSTPETLMAMVAMVGIVSTLWYGTVALALSVERMADMFRKGKWVIERCCGIFLILLGIFIFYEAYQRFWAPPEVKSLPMLIVAVTGLCANLVTAGLLFGSRRENLNLRGAFLHVLGGQSFHFSVALRKSATAVTISAS